ncbi:MAG: glycosyltransferase family 2 protein, partial [Ruminococcus sp.]|nr:glycosyltransferase family 2 protein [Ruminococcus sp.]
MDKISVIVPVYRVEQYLDKCLESLLAQTYKNFDIILVDDGSPDKCPIMCDDYAKNHNNIYVIHQKNAGLSAARNAALDWAFEHNDNDWFSFVDSDDWVHPRYLELVLSCAKRFNTKVTCCGSIDVTNRELKDYSIDNPEMDVRKPFEVYTDVTYDPNAVCGPLYARDLWNDLRFPVGKLHEDRFMAYQFLFKCDKIGVVNHSLYYYFMNPDGIGGHVLVRHCPRPVCHGDAVGEISILVAERGNLNVGVGRPRRKGIVVPRGGLHVLILRKG